MLQPYRRVPVILLSLKMDCFRYYSFGRGQRVGMNG